MVNLPCLYSNLSSRFFIGSVVIYFESFTSVRELKFPLEIHWLEKVAGLRNTPAKAAK